MKLTNDMLQAAIRKAIEAGLLPRRHACREDARANEELVRLVVQAALTATSQNPRGRNESNRFVRLEG